MARYTTTVQTDAPVDATFQYLADFSNVREWDPGVTEASRIDDGPLRVGSRFLVHAVAGSRVFPLRYEISELSAPDRVVLTAENSSIRSIDTMSFTSSGSGTSVTYDARLETRGLAKLVEPIMRVAFRRIGDRARDGLQRSLARLADKCAAGPENDSSVSASSDPRWGSHQG